MSTPPAAASSAAAEAADGGVLQMTAAMIEQVATMVQAKMTEWSDAFFKDQRVAIAEVSDKVEQVVDAFVTTCSPDFSDDVSGGVQIPTHYAQLLDQLRSTQPAVYALLLDQATQLNVGDPLQAKAFVKGALEAVIAKVGGPPAPAPASR